MISSSEDETIQSEPQSKRKKHAAKYKCPPDFVSFSHKPCSKTLKARLSDSNTELWLIKAPNNFSAACFSSLKMPLSGLQTIQAPASSGSGKIYSILGGASGTAELCLLTSRARKTDEVVCGPAFKGLLNVCESYGDVSTNLAPQAIPAAPAPCIPPGLRQRFQPFGSKTPTLTQPLPVPSGSSSTFTSTSLTAPLVVKQEAVSEEERRRIKKKKKKKKREEEEEEEERVVRVKVEPVAVIPCQEEAPEVLEETDPMEERRRKKKKKRDKDRGEGEREMDVFEVKEEIEEVKLEPVDYSYGDTDDSGKKKKKKKKSKHDHD